MPRDVPYDEEQVLITLRRITRAAEMHSYLLLRDLGVTGPQLWALRAISRLQPVSAGSLSREVHTRLATLSGVIARLAAHGYITRQRDPADQRSLFLRMTPEGERLLASAPPMLHDQLRHELRQMSGAERKLLLDLFSGRPERSGRHCRNGLRAA